MSSDVQDISPVSEAGPNESRRGVFQAGTPQERGPGCGALFGHLYARYASSVWFPVVGKTLVAVCAVASIAWLGGRAEEDDAYGRPVDLAAVRATAKDQTAAEPEPTRSAAGPPPSEEREEPDPCEPTPSSSPPGITEDGKVILNVASKAEFTRLRGVGEKRAAAIVALRERLGKFRKVSDLLRVRGIGWKSLQKLKEHVVLEPPARPPPDEEDGGEGKATAQQ